VPNGRRPASTSEWTLFASGVSISCGLQQVTPERRSREKIRSHFPMIQLVRMGAFALTYTVQ
jgi:hypothetical protein